VRGKWEGAEPGGRKGAPPAPRRSALALCGRAGALLPPVLTPGAIARCNYQAPAPCSCYLLRAPSST
jgi:hypothetical protein